MPKVELKVGDRVRVIKFVGPYKGYFAGQVGTLQHIHSTTLGKFYYVRLEGESVDIPFKEDELEKVDA